MAINIKKIEQDLSQSTTKKDRQTFGSQVASNDDENFNKPDHRKTSLSFDFLTQKKLTNEDRMFFTEQLALLLDTGNSLLESLQALSAHSTSPALKTLVTKMCDDVQQGRSFSQTLAQHPQFFSTTYCNLIHASEQGGFMADVLEELMEMDEKRSKLQATIQSALSYPVFLLGFSFLVVLFVLLVVFPKFGEMFASMQDTLPASTKYLMAFSDSIRNRWPVYIAALIGIVSTFWYWAKSQSGSLFLDGLKLKLPIVKSVFSELYLIQSMRVMGLSMSKGVSVVDTLKSCRDVVANEHYRLFFRELEVNVQNGKGLSSGFRQNQFIPDIVKQMITTGEASGDLPKVMSRVASYYERQLEKRLDTLSKAAEPIMLLVMGVVVGVLVSSLILPIFQMSKVAG